MNFTTFPVGATNIFPIANSHAGGQLLTEFNLRSRESVDTDQSIKYMVGHSYVHAQEDFFVQIQSDESGMPISNTALEILPGRGVFNGHYVETLVPMIVDLAEANANRKPGEPALKGELAIGVRIMYSTEPTMAGAIKVENDRDMYEGVQIVILPYKEFITPVQSPTDEFKVTGHLLLATFNYYNGVITNITNNEKKVHSISAERIGDTEKLLDGSYVGKNGLNSNKLYTFAGKGTDPSTGKDTWCDSTDSLMVWDADPKTSSNVPRYSQAQFVSTVEGASLVIPHKQIDNKFGGMTTTDGTKIYYVPVELPLPLADYYSETAGIVNGEYTQKIKRITTTLDNIYTTLKGKQVAYIEVLNSTDELPEFNQNWSVGDYVLVGQDNTQEVSGDGVRAPSTMYVVLPGIVSTIGAPKKVTGEGSSDSIPYPGVELETRSRTSEPDADYNKMFGLPSVAYRGTVNVDYFKYQQTQVQEDGESKVVATWYYPVSLAQDKEYSSAVFVTAEIPLAQEEAIGGFLNVPSTYQDAGYVYRDENGHLRLLDYGLLRSGTLAYQLGHNEIVSPSLDYSGIQEYLDEMVNLRVAFPDSSHFVEVSEFNSKLDDDSLDLKEPYVIEVTLTLPKSSETATVNITGIDSRFNTAVYLHILGDADANTSVNITNCQKIRIDNNIEGSPRINLYSSCLYYDSSVIDSLSEVQDMSLWYQRYHRNEPNLLVNGMTVMEQYPSIVPSELDFWNEQAVNDHHYKYALQSITLGSDGTVIGCGMLVKNETTANIDVGNAASTAVVSKMTLPQGAGLTYPPSKIVKKLKVTGSFVSAYPTKSDDGSKEGYMILDTNFTALVNPYDASSGLSEVSGTVSFYVKPEFVTYVTGVDNGTPVDGWDSGSYHIFYGGVIA